MSVVGSVGHARVEIAKKQLLSSKIFCLSNREQPIKDQSTNRTVNQSLKTRQVCLGLVKIDPDEGTREWRKEGMNETTQG